MGEADMAGKGLRRMGWIVLAIVLLAGAAALALNYSIGQNGPKVLDTVDRLTGGSRGVELVHSEKLGENPKQKIAVYRTAGADSDGAAKPVFLFIHGGGWRSGDIDDYGFLARGLAPEGYVVVLAGYRLGPDGVFPAMLEDSAKAVAWTKTNIAQYGGNPDEIFISGHSAGAYNVAMIGLDQQWLGREGLKTSDIAGIIGISGPYDFYPFDAESTKLAFGGAGDPLTTQPVNFARADAPPILLAQGEVDTVVKPRNTAALAKAITEKGGKVQTDLFADMDHNAPILALASPWRSDRRFIDVITGFTKKVLAGRAKLVADGPTVTDRGGQASVQVKAGSR
ncbi:MAG: alpha/beta hydrolase [Pontixanthobacter sp.]